MTYKPSWLSKLQEEDRSLTEDKQMNTAAAATDVPDEIDELLCEIASNQKFDQIEGDIIEIAYETDKNYKITSATHTSFLCSALRGLLEREAEESGAPDFFSCFARHIDNEEHEILQEIGLNEKEYKNLLQRKLYPWDIDPEKLKRMHIALGIKLNELIASIQATIPEPVMVGSSIARKDSTIEKKDQKRAQEVTDYYLALKRESSKKNRLIEDLKKTHNSKGK